MTEQPKRRRKSEPLPAWQLSMITAVISLILVFLLAGLGGLLLNDLFKLSVDTKDPIEDLFSYLVTGIGVAIACFFICRKYPRSYWYVPVISNALGIMAAFDPTFWSTERWMAYGTGWALSIIGSALGALLARQKTEQAN